MRFLAALGATVLLATVGAVLPPAAAAQVPQDQVWQYSYNQSCNQAAPIDPINVVFLGGYSIDALIPQWSWHLPEWDWSTSPANQTAIKASGSCTLMEYERATDEGGDRRHARWLDFGYGSGEPDLQSRDHHIHVTAHYDEDECSPFWPFDCDHSVPEDGFVTPREEVIAGFTTGPGRLHALVKREQWGNDALVEQANGEFVGGDGYVAYITVYHPACEPWDTTC